jgi:uncharacterized protein (DUF433 family)
MMTQDSWQYETNEVQPFVTGTTVSVYRIAALVRRGRGGVLDLAEASYGYPTLTRQQILDAYDYAENFPKSGKPYPPKCEESVDPMIDWLSTPDCFGTDAADN